MKEAPYALLPYQQKWLADKNEVKLFTKSRRIGISWAEAADAALTASSAAGMNITYICYDKDITRQFIKDAADWAKAYDLAASEIDERIEIFSHDDEDKSILIYRIYFASGFEIEAIAGTPRKLRGRKGRVIIDEAAFLDDLGSVIEATLALLIWGGDVRLITTYNGIENAYYELEQDVLAGKYPYSRHFVTFQDAISQGLYERICLTQNKVYSAKTEAEFVDKIYSQFGDRASQELDCIPAQSGGAYLPRVVIEQCMDKSVPVIKIELKDAFALRSEDERFRAIDTMLVQSVKPWLEACDPHLRSFFGMDFARVGDLSVLLCLQLEENLVRKAVFGLELRNVPYEQQKQILFYVADRLPRLSAGALDKGGNGGYLAEVALLKYGSSRIHAIQLSQPWYGENFPKYKSALEDRKVVLPSSSDWLDDHRMVILDKGIPKIPDKKFKGADGLQRHGDSAIAGVLAWFASLNASAPIEFKAVGQASFGSRLGDYFGGGYG